MLHSGLLAEPYGLENGMDHGLQRGRAIEWGHDASMDNQELLCPQHCFMEWFCNRSPGAKKHESAMFLLLGFRFRSLAWYARFPLPCYKKVLRKSILCLFGPLRPFKIMFWNWNLRDNYLIEQSCSGVIILTVFGTYNYDVFRTVKELLRAARLSKVLSVRILWGWGELTRAVCWTAQELL